MEGIAFPGRWGGVNLPNIPGVRGYIIGKYFPWVLMVRKRVTKKAQQFTTTTSLKRIYKTQAINDLNLKLILKLQGS